MALPLRPWRGLERPKRELLGLLDVEDVVQLDERPLPLDLLQCRPPLLVPDGVAPLVAGGAPLPGVDVHDGRPLLALADVPAGLLDLAVAAPGRVGVAAFEPVQGQVQRVAAAVVAPAGEVVREDALARLPRLLLPRGALFERLDDARGELLVVLSGLLLELAHHSPSIPPPSSSKQTTVPTRRRFNTFLFDLDGTLIDSTSLIMASFRQTMRTHLGTVPDEAVWRAGFGTPLRPQLRKFARDDHHAAQMVDTYRAYTNAHHDRLLKSYAGIAEVLGDLREAGMRLAVVTSKAHALALRGLRRCELNEYFGVLVGADDVSQHKPHPAPVLAALARLSASRRRCWRRTAAGWPASSSRSATASRSTRISATTCGAWSPSTTSQGSTSCWSWRCNACRRRVPWRRRPRGLLDAIDLAQLLAEPSLPGLLPRLNLLVRPAFVVRPVHLRGVVELSHCSIPVDRRRRGRRAVSCSTRSGGASGRPPSLRRPFSVAAQRPPSPASQRYTPRTLSGNHWS